MPVPTYEQFMNALTSFVKDEVTNCNICTGTTDTYFETSCGHLYCIDCAHKWFKISYTCPTCRRHVYDKATVPVKWQSDLAAFDFEQYIRFTVDRHKVALRISEFAAAPVPTGPIGLALIEADEFMSAILGAMIYLRGEASYECRHMVSEHHAWTREYTDIYIGTVHKINAFLMRIQSKSLYETVRLKRDLAEWIFPPDEVDSATKKDPPNTVRYFSSSDARDVDISKLPDMDSAAAELTADEVLDMLHLEAGKHVLADIDLILDFAITQAVTATPRVPKSTKAKRKWTKLTI
ncbi:hypothetical protein DOTSEDRAFT_38735 [Dothistroma septosporum NZE10]|uniref:RING-type domain-containing protein n=1 Tax=Dothistroma septosporum (strain NZE10 / CBS 128990) TaxID=675120 RepID=M2YL21_DOTSN|nr:hypothetical protein DOTSEDRAFT_38735 [Dothistroma septosporum NZE10]